MGTMTTHEEFLADRLTGIGGSDVAAVFNVGWGCRKRLWLQKRSVTSDYPSEETGPMELGKILEPFAAEKYFRKTGRIQAIEPMQRHPEIGWAIVHTDRIIYDEAKGGLENPGVLEIKCLGRGMYSKVKREGLPEDYALQLQHGMFVKNYTWGAFAVANRDNWDMLDWDADRNQGIIDEIRDQGGAFWAQVENGPMPETLEPDDKRCQKCEYRKSCQGAALIQISGTDIDRDDALLPLLAEYDERKSLFTEAEELLDEVKEDLRTMMGDRGAVECAGDRRIYYRAQVSMRIDTKALRLAMPQIAKQFERRSESRSLRIY